MTEFGITRYSRYHVRPTRRAALKALFTGRGSDLDGDRVQPVISFGVGVQRMTVTAYGGGGASECDTESLTRPALGGPGGHWEGGTEIPPAPGRHRRVPDPLA